MPLHATLPYPPSANRNVRHASGHFYTAPKVVEYRRQVSRFMEGAPTFNEPVSLAILVFPPNRRKHRDLDNILKVLLDALVRAGVLEDDDLVRRIAIEWDDVFAGGKVEMLVEEYRPLQNWAAGGHWPR